MLSRQSRTQILVCSLLMFETMEEVQVREHGALSSDTAFSDAGQRSACFHKLFSKRTKQEVKALVTLAWPTVFSYFFYHLLSMVSFYFAGHLGKSELAAAALAISFINVTSVSVGTGLASALETLCSQAFGAKNYTLVGVVLQRGVWILGISCVPVWALWINTELMLLLFHQGAETSRYVQGPGANVRRLITRFLSSHEQYIFSPLGNKVFHAKLFNCFSHPTWPP